MEAIATPLHSRGSMTLATYSTMRPASDRLAQQQLSMQQTSHASRLPPTPSRVEKMTPTRLPLSRHALHRSNSSLSTRHRPASVGRPLSWNPDPRFVDQYLKMAYTQKQQQQQQTQRMMQFQQYLHSDFPVQQSQVPFYQQYNAGYSMPQPAYGHVQSWTNNHVLEEQQQLQQQQVQHVWGTDQRYAQMIEATPSSSNHLMPHPNQDDYSAPSELQMVRSETEPLFASSKLQQQNPSTEPLDTVLVGLGLYDRDPSSIALSGQPHSNTAFTDATLSLGKGLKLEESWQPSAEDDATTSSPPASSPVPELDSSPIQDPYSSFESERDEYYDEVGPSYSAANFAAEKSHFSQHNDYVYGSYYTPPQLGSLHPQIVTSAHPSSYSADCYSANDAPPTFKSSEVASAGVFHPEMVPYNAAAPMMWHSAVPQWNM